MKKFNRSFAALRMTNLKPRMTSLFGMLIFSMCFQVSYAQTTSAPTEFTQEKPVISLTPNNATFVIKLKSNPTTGYSWFLRDYNASLLQPIKHRYEAPTDHKLMGASGYEFWTFKAKPIAFTVPQQTTIRFVYARPWEANDSATQIAFKVTTSGKVE